VRRSIGKPIDFVFLEVVLMVELFRALQKIVKGKADNVTAWLVPGSHL
jgi:hypothetical protein